MRKIDPQRKVGVAIIGAGDSVGSTVAAACLLLRHGHVGLSGLPLAGRDIPKAVGYHSLWPAGWDVNPVDLNAALFRNRVFEDALRLKVADELASIRPWPTIQNTVFCRDLDGENSLATNSNRAAIQSICEQLGVCRI